MSKPTQNTPIGLIIIIVDVLIHTDVTPFCDDESCPCQFDRDELLEQQEMLLDAQAQESYESPYQQFLESIVDDAEYSAYLDHVHIPKAEAY